MLLSTEGSIGFPLGSTTATVLGKISTIFGFLYTRARDASPKRSVIEQSNRVPTVALAPPAHCFTKVALSLRFTNVPWLRRSSLVIFCVGSLIIVADALAWFVTGLFTSYGTVNGFLKRVPMLKSSVLPTGNSYPSGK